VPRVGLRDGSCYNEETYCQVNLVGASAGEFGMECAGQGAAQYR